MASEAIISIGELLDQDKIWQRKDGRELVTVRLDDMELQHLKALRAWLLRNSDSIQYGLANQLHSLLARVNGEQAELDLERELARLEDDPEAWMRGTVLFEALTERLETVPVEKFNRIELATLLHLVRIALSEPQRHSKRQIETCDRLRRKLEGTGKQA